MEWMEYVPQAPLTMVDYEWVQPAPTYETVVDWVDEPLEYIERVAQAPIEVTEVEYVDVVEH